MDTVPIEPRRNARKPIRKHAQERFDLLLEATESLLAEDTGEDISLAQIAERSEVPLTSVYHFFPNRNAALVALAERFHASFRYMANSPHTVPPQSWQELVLMSQRRAANYLNEHPGALRLLMGAGVSAEVRNADVRGNAALSRIRAEQFSLHFDMPKVPDLDLRIAVSIAVADGVWALSYGTHRRVTEAFLEESARASICYLRCFLPEVLSVRNSVHSLG